MIYLHIKYMMKLTSKWNHLVMFKAQSDRIRETEFADLIDQRRMIPYASIPEAVEILKELQPDILHHTAAGIAEFPMIPGIRDIIPKTKLVQTAVFSNKNDHLKLDAVIHVSRHVKNIREFVNTDGEYVIGNPIENSLTEENLRKELNIDKDIFVFGHIGRPDPNTYDNTNLIAYSKIEDEKTCFILMGVDELAKSTLEELGIKNYRLIPKTIDRVKLSKFYNTINVLAHCRKDGECASAVISSALAHGIPILSAYGAPFNGHIEQIGDCGWVVLKDDVDEYARIMKSLILGEIKLSKNRCYKRYNEYAHAETQAQKLLDVYEHLTK